MDINKQVGCSLPIGDIISLKLGGTTKNDLRHHDGSPMNTGVVILLFLLNKDQYALFNPDCKKINNVKSSCGKKIKTVGLKGATPEIKHGTHFGVSVPIEYGSLFHRDDLVSFFIS